MIPKFKIDDIVYIKNEYDFNPCEKVTTIAKIEAIHYKNGEELGYNPRYRTKPKKLKEFVYSISGTGARQPESLLELWKG